MALLVAGGGFTVGPGQALGAGTGVHQDVGWPAEDLVEDEGSDGDNGRVGIGVVHDLLEKGWLSLPGLDIGLAGRDENRVLVHVVVVSVVTRVAELPAEKGDHQDAVQEPSGDGVDGEVVGKRVMTAVVGQDPKTGKETPLDKAVQRPQGNGDEPRGIEPGNADGRVEESAHDDEVANDIREGADHGALEALGWNGIFERLDIGNGRDGGGGVDVSHSREPCLDRIFLDAGRGRNHGWKRREWTGRRSERARGGLGGLL